MKLTNSFKPINQSLMKITDRFAKVIFLVKQYYFVVEIVFCLKKENKLRRYTFRCFTNVCFIPIRLLIG